jgi:hypothetical protein
MNNLTIHRASLSDAPIVAGIFHSMYPNSTHPFGSTVAVAEFLKNPLNYQVIAEDADRIVASMAMISNRWNDYYELGRALTLPAYLFLDLSGLVSPL